MKRLARWQWAWLALATLTLLPVAHHAYQSMQETARELRVQLIQRYSLWETDRHYAGTPQSWTRFAAWLLDTEQLMQRVQEKHGKLAEQIGQDFELDTVFAQGRVIAVHAVAWGAPLAALYAALWYFFSKRAGEKGDNAKARRRKEKPT